MYEINTLLLLPLKIYFIVLKHIKSLILLKKLVFISNFNVFILMSFVFYSSLKIISKHWLAYSWAKLPIGYAPEIRGHSTSQSDNARTVKITGWFGELRSAMGLKYNIPGLRADVRRPQVVQYAPLIVSIAVVRRTRRSWIHCQRVRLRYSGQPPTVLIFIPLYAAP